MSRFSQSTSTRRRMFAAVTAMALIAAGCGGSKAGDSTGPEGTTLADIGLSAEAGESGLDEAGDPQRGGTLIYGLEADTTSYCLPEAQLAISGQTVAKSIYEPLVTANADGELVGYLAESFAHNDDYTEWTFKIRAGVTFHDGSDLTAQVVKNNIDAYRGVYEGRASLLLGFTLSNISDTEVVDGDSVKVTTAVPWIALPAYLSGSRTSIMGQAQIDDPDNCDKNLIGTGPFQLDSWPPGGDLTAVAYDDYWQIAPDGEPYPYADAIEFRAIPDGQVRQNSIESGSTNIIHASGADRTANDYKDLRDEGKVNLFVSEVEAEVDFLQLNHTKPPFDDVRARRALAMAIDRERLDEFIGDGYYTIATGPFAPDSVAYLDDAGYPAYDPEAARELLAEYVADGGDPSFTIASLAEPTVRRTSELVQQQAGEVGFDINISERDQAALINDAIGKGYQAMFFRNYPGGDPDNTYVWWYSGTTAEDGTFTPNSVNFGGWVDEEVDRLLDAGRSELDPDKRVEIYQDLNRRMASEVHGGWSWYTPWALVTGPNVHGVLGPPLPDGSEPSLQISAGNRTLGMWISS